MNLKNKRGITLIALVITIILLLILAGITITQLSNNGLFGKSQEAKERSENAIEKEEAELAKYENEINNYITGNRDYSPISYSTEEQDTGLKWIDGKPIYQKTVLVNISGDGKVFEDSNIEKIINYNGYLINGQDMVPIIGYWWNASEYCYSYVITYKGIYVHTTFQGKQGCITLQYTKI